MKVLLATAYWPNLHYMFYILNAENINIEQFENFQKQSFRNRTCILTANGLLNLSIPVKNQAIKEFTKDIQISYQENWHIKHWRAIESAYKNSPYFDFFEDDIKYFYDRHFDGLLDYNTQQLKLILKLLRIKKEINFTTIFKKETETDVLDLRASIHPKVDFHLDKSASLNLERPYYQTFGEKFPFQKNISILDLLFNKGLETKEILTQIK